MRKIVSLLLLLALFVNASAQEENKTNPKWKKGGLFSLNVGQGGSRNWAAGAEKFSFSLATYLNLNAQKKSGKFTWDKNFDFGYAMIRTESLGTRKNDDKIDLYSKMGWTLSTTTSVGVIANLRTQFTDGYDYDYLNKGFKKRTSGFFAPAYATLAPGLDWHPKDYFSIFITPIAARWVIVTYKPRGYYFQGGVIPASEGGGFEVPLAVLYGVDPDREVKFELGGFASINFNKEIFKNVTYKTRVDLFSNYLSTSRFTPIGPNQLKIEKVAAKPKNVDVFWTNVISMRVNKFLQVTYNFDLIYDDDVRQFGPNNDAARAQMRSLLAVGLAAKW